MRQQRRQSSALPAAAALARATIVARASERVCGLQFIELGVCVCIERASGPRNWQLAGK